MDAAADAGFGRLLPSTYISCFTDKSFSLQPLVFLSRVARMNSLLKLTNRQTARSTNQAHQALDKFNDFVDPNTAALF